MIEGRDKFCKAVQYASRILKWYLPDKDPQLAARFNALFAWIVAMRDARKLFRLFKSINEYQKLMSFVGDKTSEPLHRNLNIVSRLGFLLYWVYDNINVLATVKFINADAKQAAKTACLFWFIGLVSGLILYVINLIEVLQKEALLLSDKQINPDLKIDDKLKLLKYKKLEAVLNIAKTLGDMVTASNGMDLPLKLFGKAFNDGQVGLGGLVSAVITMYQLYPSSSKK